MNKMVKKQYPAIDVLQAAQSVFASAGDQDYAKVKANNFLQRCGADINKPKEQPLKVSEVKGVAYAMLDADLERDFWNILNRGE